MADPNLRVRISADLADIKQGLGLLRGELAKVKQQSAAALSGGNTNALVNGLKRVRQEITGLVGAYASLAGARLLVGVTDEATRLRGRLREAKGDYQSILAVAQSTRTGLAATVDLYARIERSTRGQIKSQGDLLTLTKSVNQAIKLSYTGTAQGEAAVLQLGQALASGKLAGDEFRSISENAPRLMQALADGLGKPVGALKDLAKQGKLTSEVVVKALLGQSQVLESEYKRVPVTIGDAFTQIRNSFVDFIGNADEANGASRKFAATLQEIAKNLPQYLNPLLDTIRLLVENLDVLAVFIGTRLAASAVPALIVGVGNLRKAFVALRVATLEWSVVAAAMGGPIGIVLAAIAAALYLVWKRTNDAKQAEEQHRKVLEDIDQQAQKNIVSGYQMAAARRQEARDALNAAKAQLQLAKARFAVENTSVTARGGDRGDAAAFASTNNLNRQQARVDQLTKQEAELTAKLLELEAEFKAPPPIEPPRATVDLPETADKAKKAIKGVVDTMGLAVDEVQRKLDTLEQQFQAGNLRLVDYFAQKRDLLLQSIDLQIKQAQAEAKTATTSDQQSQALTRIIKLQRDRAQIGPQVAREQAKAEKELTDQLELLRAKLADLSGGFGNEAAARLKDEYEALLKKLGDSAEGKDLAGKIFNIESAKARIDEIQAKAEQVIANLRSSTDYINSQQQLGVFGPAEAERQLFALRASSIEQLRQYKLAAEAALAAQAPGTPQHAAALQGLATINGALADAESAQHQFANSVKQGAVDALAGFFTDLATGAKNFKDAFKSMVLNFIQGLARMAAQALAQRIIFSLFKLPVPSANGNVFGSGGMQKFAKGAAFALPGLMAFANGAAFTNGIFDNPTLFQFGSGGQFGVMGEAGPEAVMPLTRGPDGRLGVDANGGARAPIVKQPIVAIGDKAVADALRSSYGRDVILTVVRENWEGLSRGDV